MQKKRDFDEDRPPYYFSASKPPKRLPKSQAEERLGSVLAPESAHIVEAAVKSWREILRQAVRDTTALKFTDETGKSIASVPIKVVAGLPEPLAEATSNLDTWQWWLILHRPELEQADLGLKLVVDNRPMIENVVGEASGGMAATKISRKFLARILSHHVEKDLFAAFRAIRTDVFGAYWIQATKIQIYWMPLAIFAPLLRVSLATLTVVVLCHELVHAYTHCGLDLDKERWSTDRFMRSDPHVIEGLAQYYTEQIMRNMESGRLPDGLATFLAKTEHQSSAYTAYQSWLGDKKQPSPEATRLAMLEFRNSSPPVFGHHEFVEMLKGAQARMQGGSGKF